MNNVKIPFNFIFLRAHVCYSRTHKGVRMRIAVIGQSLFGQEVYKELRKDGHTIVGVFTIPDKDGKADPLGKNSQRQHHFNGNINWNTAFLLSPKQCWKWLFQASIFFAHLLGINWWWCQMKLWLEIGPLVLSLQLGHQTCVVHCSVLCFLYRWKYQMNAVKYL